MLYIIIFAISAGLNGSLFKQKGRSFVLGAILGFFLPLISIFIAWKMKPKENSTMSAIVKSSTVLKLEEERNEFHPVTKPSDNSLLVPQSGNFRLDVVGESHYFPELRQITSRLGGDGEYAVIAHLVAEPSNTFDRHAIRVDIDGMTCGYLPKDLTSEIRPLLEYAKRKSCSLSAKARVWAGTASYSESGTRAGNFIASVSLDIGTKIGELFPLNEPQEGEVVWPQGSLIKAIFSLHQENSLHEILKEAYVEGICAVYLAVIEIVDEKGKPTLGLLFKDNVIAHLTTISSNKFLPTLKKLPRDRRLLALCTLTGNAVALDLRVDLLSPEKLTSVHLMALGLQ